jgi:hypothetical protein
MMVLVMLALHGFARFVVASFWARTEAAPNTKDRSRVLDPTHQTDDSRNRLTCTITFPPIDRSKRSIRIEQGKKKQDHPAIDDANTT